MSLRLRLILAFFVLSIVPLAAVTVYTYQNNVKTVRAAAELEANLLAGELGQRMQIVTTQISERVEHLMDMPAAPSTSVASSKTGSASSSTTKPSPKPASTAPVAPVTPASPASATQTSTAVAQASDPLTDKVALALGEAAMMLNNVELHGLRGFDRTMMRQLGQDGGPPQGDNRGRSGRGGGGGANVAGGAGSTGGRGSGGRPTGASAGAGSGAGTGSATASGSTTTAPPPPPPGGPPPVPPAVGAGGDGRSGFSRNSGRGSGDPSRGGPQRQRPEPGQPPPGQPPGQPPPLPPPASLLPGQTAAVVTLKPVDPADPNALKDAKDKILIDLAPIRRDLLRQFVPDGQLDQLTPEQRQRVLREVNQYMLGITKGIQLGAVGLQKRAEDAQRDAEAAADKATPKPADKKTASAKTTNAAPQSAPAPAVAGSQTVTPAIPLKRRTELTGNKLGVTMEQDGKVVQQVSAEINLPNVLATVFSTTRTDRGEVPFAVGKDGHLFTPTEIDRARIASLGPALAFEGPPTHTTIQGDWIVVTTLDKSGSGLRFGIARPIGDSMTELRRTAARNTTFGLLFIGLAAIVIVPLSGRLTRNLTTLTDAASRIAHGDFTARVPVKSHDEIGRLAGAFNSMAADVERHHRSAVEQERIRRELELGRQIQHEMLPHAPLRLGLTEVKGVSVPAREVGGDFFNYFEIADGQIALLVGDVSGKGVGAALLMANIQASLRTRLSLGRDLAAITDAIDRDIGANSPGPVYATLFVGILDPATRRLRYVNAGHHPQFVLRQSGGLEHMASTGMPVGLMAGRGYTEGDVQLQAGDLLFFYTDGCVEAENEREDMFSSERLEALLTSVAATGPDDVLQRVEKAVNTFRGTREPFDDETMMAVKVG